MALGVTRALSLLYAFSLSYRSLRPPASLTGDDDDTVSAKEDSDKKTLNNTRSLSYYMSESWVTAAMFRRIFVFALVGMTVTDLAILHYFNTDGVLGFLNKRWSVRDVMALGVMSGGVKLREDSFRALGEYFTFKVTTKADQKLITTGPYLLLMHPSYTGLILQRTALVYFLGLQNSTLWFLGYTVCGLPGIIGRIVHEERELRNHFGEEKYDEYRRNRWRLIPYVL